VFDLDLKLKDLSGITNENELEGLAVESGVAIVVVDEAGFHIVSANNNSICRTLNPDGKLTGMCRDFCGTALEETRAVGGPVFYTCHAGLSCAATPAGTGDRPLVTIVGRSFVNSGNYRRATARAIDGDWTKFSAADLFENVLMSPSDDEIKAVARKAATLVTRVTAADAAPEASETRRRVESIVDRFNREIGLAPATPAPDAEAGTAAPVAPVSEGGPRALAAGEWRSFLDSLLKSDYTAAVDTILGLLARQYGFASMLWLDEREGRLETARAYAEMSDRRVRLGIGTDDSRLAEAVRRQMPLELSEKTKDGTAPSRMMYLFPVAIGDDILAAVAVFDRIESETVKDRIAKLCRTLAPQLEILRLRSEVAFRETLAAAVRRFSASLRRIDSGNVWHELTQSAAEMLGAERASLLVFDPKADGLALRWAIGARQDLSNEPDAGERVSTVVFSMAEPVVVTDVTRTALPPVPERGYRTNSFLSCPISVGGRMLGIMNFTDRADSKAFDGESVELFHAIAPQIGVAVDRALLQEKAGEFEQLSVTDPLTGLLNRRYIEERLTEEVKRSNRHGFPMSFMMLDVDEFKSYNDQFGHPAGDEALKLVAHVVRDTLRGADVAARFGGEEFSILLPQTTGEEAEMIAERIRHNVEQADFPHRRVTLSIGIANCSAELCSAKNIVSAADKALYEAKRAGRNQVRTFSNTSGARNGVRQKASR
jgi:diguanylate cyclase (GGDEF)-like protein